MNLPAWTRWLAPVLAVAHLLLGLCLLGDYGPTWDAVLGDYAYGERNLAALLHGEPVDLAPGTAAPTGAPLAHREPHPDFRLTFGWYQLYPFAATLSAASCQVFHTWLGWLAPFSAHHLVIVVFGAVLVFAMVRLMLPALGPIAATSSVVLLFSAPGFFAHACNNLKDVPETCLYALASIATYRALTGGAWRSWCMAGACAAMALAQKANALFLPVQGVLLVALLPLGSATQRLSCVLRGIPIAGATFVAVYFACSPALWHDTLHRLGLHFGEMLRVGNPALTRGGPLVVSWHGVESVLHTTPVPMLLLAAVGAVSGRIRPELRWFLLVWLLLPIGRTLLPGMASFDGVRHFLEFHPPLALLAGVGVATLWGACRRGVVRVGLVGALLVPGLFATWQTHPNGICWFNSFAGSLLTQQALGNADATDYWGNSYWQALQWLDEHAVSGARVVATVNPAIVEAAAPCRLRPDLVVWDGLAEDGSAEVVYVVYVTRKTWYGAATAALADDASTLVHEIRVQGAPVLRMHELRGEARDRFLDAWRREHHAATGSGPILAWLAEHPEHLAEASQIMAALQAGNIAGAEAALRQLLPPQLQAAADQLLRAFR